MPKPALVEEYSGSVDFGSHGPVLETESGRRWRLEGGDSLFIGEDVTIAATRLDPTTLRVRAVLQSHDPYVSH
jgi:hypothetical protein